nr:uncharacterized protein LOC127301342 [Lolium perenne]XP_051217937.1 uncharacterized protein LOC127335343 [Lolium perenne]
MRPGREHQQAPRQARSLAEVLGEAMTDGGPWRSHSQLRCRRRCMSRSMPPHSDGTWKGHRSSGLGAAFLHFPVARKKLWRIERILQEVLFWSLGYSKKYCFSHCSYYRNYML